MAKLDSQGEDTKQGGKKRGRDATDQGKSARRRLGDGWRSGPRFFDGGSPPSHLAGWLLSDCLSVCLDEMVAEEAEEAAAVAQRAA